MEHLIDLAASARIDAGYTNTPNSVQNRQLSPQAAAIISVSSRGGHSHDDGAVVARPPLSLSPLVIIIPESYLKR